VPARDHSLALRGAVFAALRGDQRVSGHVGAHVFAEQPPQDKLPADWKWIRVGPVRAEPFETSTEAGSDASWMVHVFTDDSTLAHQINAAVVYALDEKRLPLEPEATDDPDNPPYVMDLLWQGSEVLNDTAREGGYHGVVRFTATTAEGA
jgi:hypothetical protein